MKKGEEARALVPRDHATCRPDLFCEFERGEPLPGAEGDRDMVAMLHKTEFTTADGEHKLLQATTVWLGDDAEQTAMAKTVGLPLGIGALRVLDGTITRRGVVIPTVRDVYEPVLAELEQHGVRFEERLTDL